MLNKVKQGSNMYQFCTYTFNILKGRCSHNCLYCYVKRFPQTELHFDEKELKTKLGSKNTIFVGSSCDMFAEDVLSSWILNVLSHCKEYPDNTYIFQTKNPKRFVEFKNNFPEKTILGITIETNQLGFNYNAPSVEERVYWFSKEELHTFKRFVTIEPIISFSVEPFAEMIKRIKPEFVNIGADSNHKRDYILPEPSKEDIKLLVKELEKFTKVNLKSNLKRLMLEKHTFKYLGFYNFEQRIFSVNCEKTKGSFSTIL